MAAYSKRQKTRPNYDPYPHENTHVFLPDGSQHLVEKTRIGRTSKDLEEEFNELIGPWEKDSILGQNEEQKTPQWKQYVMPSGATPLDKGGLRAARTNVAPDKVKNWDSFEISFDRSDVADPARQEAVFNEVVEWAKQIHTEGLEGGRRAFTIQDWHGLDGTSARPHLRLEMHRIGWEPVPQLIEAGGDRKVLSGKVQSRQNYSQESGETDKDFQPLVLALRDKFGIELQLGSHAPTREAEARWTASEVPSTPGAAIEEATRLLTKVQATDVASAAPVDGSFVVPNGVGSTNREENRFDLRPPVDPFRQAVEEKFTELQKIQKEFDLVRAAHATYAANEQLTEQVRVQTVHIQDLQTEVSRKDAALVERDQALEQATSSLAVAGEQLELTLTQTVKLSNELEDRTEELKEVQESVAVLEATSVVLVEERDKALDQVTELTHTNQALGKQVEGLKERVATTEGELLTTKQDLDLVKRERDGLESRNGALAERNGELLGENKVVNQRLVEVQGELKLAREELAPIVAENAELKAERDRLTQENHDLSQGNEQLQAEIERRKLQQNRLKALTTMDNETLNAKVVALHERLDEMSSSRVLRDEPDMRELLREIKGFIQTKEQYVSRSEVYVEEGMPLPGEPNFASTHERIQAIHSADGDFGRKGRELALASAERDKAASQPSPEQNANAAPRPVVQGPRPNPQATGAVPPRTTGGTGRNDPGTPNR